MKPWSRVCGRIGLFLGLAGLGPLKAAPFSYFRGEPLRIGNEIQFLMDDAVVEDRWMLRREVGEVVKHLRNPILVQDQPWEGASGSYPCVLYDSSRSQYRMWYESIDKENYFGRHGPGVWVEYAESPDGFNWVKPELEGFPFKGYPRTNVVTAGRRGEWAALSQVIFNPDQSDAGKRMIMIYTARKSVDIAFSPDGFHWTVREKPILPYHSDFPNHMVWVPERRLWFLYCRPNMLPNGQTTLPEGLRHTGRRLALSTSPDLEHWSMPRTILYADELDPPDYDIATVFRRHGLFIALYAVMNQEHGSGEVDTCVATSRDGLHFERIWDRTPLVPRGPVGAFDHGQVEARISSPLIVGDDMLIYYLGSPSGQPAPVAESAVGVCRLRIDRFIGQRAGNRTGYLLTRQFILEGTKLNINCRAPTPTYQRPDDGIRVAIVAAPDFDKMGVTWENPIPGYTLDDCDPIIADAISRTVTWKGKPDLTPLKGRPVYLRFQMKSAQLYTFQIAP